MSRCKRARSEAKLRDWITKHAKKSLTTEFGDETPVLQVGILSSLDIVEFVLFIESLRGEDVDPDSIEPASVHQHQYALFGVLRQVLTAS